MIKEWWQAYKESWREFIGSIWSVIIFMLLFLFFALTYVYPEFDYRSEDGYIVLQEQSIKGYSVVGEQPIKKYKIIEHQYNIIDKDGDRLFYSNGKFYHQEDLYGNSR